MKSAKLQNVLLFAISVIVSLVIAEIAVRVVQGYQLGHLALVNSPVDYTVLPNDRLEKVAEWDDMLAAIPLASGVDRRWFYQGPPALTNRALHPNADLTWRVQQAPTIPSFYFGHAYNLNYVLEEACGRNRYYYSYQDELKQFKSIYVFKEKTDIHPFYRLLKETTFPNGMVSNQFGFRGPEIPFEKPPRMIRIAFLGASTTEGQGYNPHSYPEYVGYWLNQWAIATHLPVRFETMTAGGSGYSSNDIAARFKQDVLPLQPDIAIYYEGANQFYPNSFIHYRRHMRLSPPRTSLALGWFVRNSAIVADTQLAYYKIFKRNAKEPTKPAYTVEWPAALNESKPDLTSPLLPANIKEIIASLDEISQLAGENHIIFVPTSFAWYVYPGLVLHLPADIGIYSHLNTSLWPFSYEWLSRNAAFQNAVYRQYANEHHLNFIEVANYYPRSDHLFFDAVHGTLIGQRIRAWIITQQLIPIIKAQLDAGQLPRAWNPSPTTPADYVRNRQDFKITKNEINTLCKNINGVGIMTIPHRIQLAFQKISRWIIGAR